jgi:hypothetical protein
LEDREPEGLLGGRVVRDLHVGGGPAASPDGPVLGEQAIEADVSGLLQRGGGLLDLRDVIGPGPVDGQPLDRS